VHTFRTCLRTMAGAAMLTAAVAGVPVLALAQGAAQPATQTAKPAAPEKKLAEGEYDAYNAVAVDLGKGDFTKALADLDTWKQKFPKSDYATDGKALYVQAYAGAKQFTKALDAAGDLLSGDIDALFPNPKDGPLVVLKVLLAVSQSTLQVQGATPEELATARKGAELLLKYTRKAEGYTDAQWTQLHGQVDPLAKQAIYMSTVSPGVEALTKTKNYDVAEAAFRKALQDYPENAAVAAYLGAALVGQYKVHPEKFPEGLYMYARAASVDPVAGSVTKEWQAAPAKSLVNYYTQFHGSEEGLAELKAEAVKSPTPPVGFTVKSSAEVEKDKQDAFAAAHPELAQWLATKKALTEGGEAYFKDNMADAQVPVKLKGKVLEGKPACNSKSLTLALSDDKTPEVTLVLDTPIKGKPTAGVDITWEGAVAKAFTATPFNLTMEMELAKIDGFEKTACVPGAPRPPAAKKAVPPAAKKQ